MVSVRIGAGLSTDDDPFAAGVAAAGGARAQLAGARSDLAVVFASGAHLSAPEAALEAVHEVLGPEVVVGCGAGGVLGEGRELESGTALAVWASSFDGEHRAAPFHATATDTGSSQELAGLPELEGSSAAIMLSDPYSFPTDAALALLSQEAPAVPVLGGIASARTPEGAGALFLGEDVLESGAVGVSFEGVEVLPCVSQGAAPLGPEVTITAAEGNVIHELAGRPALQTVEMIIGELTPRERALVAGGLLIGIVIDSGKPEYEQGDFLVRGVLGVDADAGSLVVGATAQTGQVVRLHARDAISADEDLRELLRMRVQAMADAPPAGALVFSCNGRGAAMFGVSNHDATVVERELGGAPAAGFFAAGEIGPVGARSFLHGFTATIAVFGR